MRPLVMVTCVAVCAACSRDRYSSGPPKRKKIDTATFKLLDKYRAEVTYTLKDADGNPTTLAESTPIQIHVELRTIAHADPLKDDDYTLCLGSTYVGGGAPNEPVNMTYVRGSHTDCAKGLLDEGYTGPVFLNVSLSGLYEDYNGKLDKLDLHDDRAANIPELDAELARLTGAVGKLAPPFAACTPELVGARHLETVDREGLLASNENGDYTTTELFNDVARYGHRHDTNPALTLQQLQKNPKIGIYVATTRTAPTSTVAGLWDGVLVVMDRATGTAACGVPIHATSSDSVSYKVTTETRGADVRQVASTEHDELKADFKSNFDAAVSTAFAPFPAARPRGGL